MKLYKTLQVSISGIHVHTRDPQKSTLRLDRTIQSRIRTIVAFIPAPTFVPENRFPQARTRLCAEAGKHISLPTKIY